MKTTILAVLALVIGIDNHANNNKQTELVPFFHSQSKTYEFVKKGTTEIVITGNWQEADLFYSGLSKVKLNDKYGFINCKGDVVIPYIFDKAENFSSGFCIAYINDKPMLYNSRGKKIVDSIYDEFGELHEGLISVMKNNKLGFIDTNGKLKIPLLLNYFPMAEQDRPYFHDGRCAVFQEFNINNESQTKFGFINKKGEWVIPAKYEIWGGAGINRYPRFSEGLAVVYNGKKFGYIDVNNKTVIPMIFDGAEDFAEGRAAIRKRDSVYFIDRMGKILIPRIFGSHDEGPAGFVYKGFNKGTVIVNLNNVPTDTLTSYYYYSEKPAVVNEMGDIVFEDSSAVYITCYNDNFICYNTETIGVIILRKSGKKINIDSQFSMVYPEENENYLKIDFEYFMDDNGLVYKD